MQAQCRYMSQLLFTTSRDAKGRDVHASTYRPHRVNLPVCSAIWDPGCRGSFLRCDILVDPCVPKETFSSFSQLFFSQFVEHKGCSCVVARGLVSPSSVGVPSRQFLLNKLGPTFYLLFCRFSGQNNCACNLFMLMTLLPRCDQYLICKFMFCCHILNYNVKHLPALVRVIFMLYKYFVHRKVILCRMRRLIQAQVRQVSLREANGRLDFYVV